MNPINVLISILKLFRCQTNVQVCIHIKCIELIIVSNISNVFSTGFPTFLIKREKRKMLFLFIFSFIADVSQYFISKTKVANFFCNVEKLLENVILIIFLYI